MIGRERERPPTSGGGEGGVDVGRKKGKK